MLRDGLEKDFFCLTLDKFFQKLSPKTFRFGNFLTQGMISLENVERCKEVDPTVLKEAVTQSPGHLKFPVCDKLRQAEIFLNFKINILFLPPMVHA